MSDDVKAISTEGELGIQVGDRVRVVVQDEGTEGDPLAFIDGTPTILHPEDDDHDIGFGDTVTVKVADIRKNQIHAVPVEGE